MGNSVPFFLKGEKMPNIVKYSPKVNCNYYLSATSNWRNPWDKNNTKDSLPECIFEESITNFRDWLSGEKFQDYDQRRRIWILNHVKYFEGNIIASDNIEYAEVLAEMMNPDFPVPEFKLEDWEEKITIKSKNKKKIIPKLDIEPLF